MILMLMKNIRKSPEQKEQNVLSMLRRLLRHSDLGKKEAGVIHRHLKALVLTICAYTWYNKFYRRD